ncbi:Glutamate synthase [NADPH] small chain [Vibrio ruber DSM 16370]|uniref:Glutamate synthase [NADPH] small chain n=1 Tax=Vibrio ruber (strain DSM 16370 / JCM 11486 / BCRC 17186 / CECT 7878 / LMG 23124 / VR1) TaxID=1123498 RepID=A0A1R4L992_VIBR1|nr:FAD-dependent oxidoreductase [Vibrio ruber]SJN52943.1 Glutamate synthase [NADPH] small chain [Vibrio ruber DSM 16370]
MVNIMIDGSTYTVDPNQTLLSATTACGIALPSLCDTDNADAIHQHCELCEVEIHGIGVVAACQEMPVEGMVITTTSSHLSERRKKHLQDILSQPNIICSEPPCQTACPAHVDIQQYLALIAQGQYQQAIAVIKKTLPMPLSIGRVCPAFCESGCQRQQLDEPLAIRQLKRHAADHDLAALQSYLPERKAEKHKKIAIVGAGPGGLSCGYFLTNEGYDVTIFEAMPQAGGWLRYGIPEYRLPKAILDQEIELMCRHGMTIKTEQRLGKDFRLSALSDNYDAVCLAIGASQASGMAYPGSDLDGCYLGVDFLKDHMLDKRCSVGHNVAVIGGGNTAIDCARTALRLGAQATIIYRRSREEMPAEDYEIEEAEHEGVQFYFLTNPVENIADQNGRVCQVKLEKMALGEPDASGRRRPQPTGEFITESFDTVISAISQQTDVSFLDNDNIELPLNRYKTIDVDEDNMFSGSHNIFAIGDFRRGPATAVEAVADGRKAAYGIDRFLGGDMETLYTESFRERNVTRSHLIRPEHLKKLKDDLRSIVHGDTQEQLDQALTQAMQHILRARMPELTLEERRLNFREVEKGFTDQAAINEARRCLSCGCPDGNDCKLRHYATEYHVDKSLLPHSDCA